MKVKITERGWPGHFCASSYCLFRRNTLVEFGKKRIVVSTVGNMAENPETNKKVKIGCDRYYETMCFEAEKVGCYWEADVSKEISFNSNWSVQEVSENSDWEANKMHDAVVKEISENLVKGIY